MNSGVTTAAGSPAVKSILDKPLHELTEDDISQLTREDCRRYLKQKGMRRPSWNKSQAIQQVISLKSLLEPTTTTTTTPPPPGPGPTTSNTATSSSSSSIKEFSARDVDATLNQLVPPSASGSLRHRDSKPLPLRITNCQDSPIGQMTIFYSGKVNVYDGVPVEKQAHAIMHLASSPIHFCQDEPSSGNSMQWTTPRQLVASSVKFNVGAPDATIVSMVSDVDGQTNRQVSLQRYFEKRKDRGKFKLKKKTGSSSGLEMYLNHQMDLPSQPTQSISSSPDQVGISHTGYGCVDKQPKNPALSVDLNDKGAPAFVLATEGCYGEVNGNNPISVAVILQRF